MGLGAAAPTNPSPESRSECQHQCRFPVPFHGNAAPSRCHFPALVPLRSTTCQCYFPAPLPLPSAPSQCPFPVPLPGATSWCHFLAPVLLPSASFPVPLPSIGAASQCHLPVPLPGTGAASQCHFLVPLPLPDAPSWHAPVASRHSHRATWRRGSTEAAGQDGHLDARWAVMAPGPEPAGIERPPGSGGDPTTVFIPVRSRAPITSGQRHAWLTVWSRDGGAGMGKRAPPPRPSGNASPPPDPLFGEPESGPSPEAGGLCRPNHGGRAVRSRPGGPGAGGLELGGAPLPAHPLPPPPSHRLVLIKSLPRPLAGGLSMLGQGGLVGPPTPLPAPAGCLGAQIAQYLGGCSPSQPPLSPWSVPLPPPQFLAGPRPSRGKSWKLFQARKSVCRSVSIGVGGDGTRDVTPPKRFPKVG